MPSLTPELDRLGGIKSYLRRTRSVEELKALADTIFSAATEEVTITGTAADGGSANGEVTFPKWLYLTAVEEVLKDLGVVAVGLDGSMVGRQLGTRPDFSTLRWSV